MKVQLAEAYSRVSDDGFYIDVPDGATIIESRISYVSGSDSFRLIVAYVVDEDVEVASEGGEVAFV